MHGALPFLGAFALVVVPIGARWWLRRRWLRFDSMAWVNAQRLSRHVHGPFRPF